MSLALAACAVLLAVPSAAVEYDSEPRSLRSHAATEPVSAQRPAIIERDDRRVEEEAAAVARSAILQARCAAEWAALRQATGDELVAWVRHASRDCVYQLEWSADARTQEHASSAASVAAVAGAIPGLLDSHGDAHAVFWKFFRYLSATGDIWWWCRYNRTCGSDFGAAYDVGPSTEAGAAIVGAVDALLARARPWDREVFLRPGAAQRQVNVVRALWALSEWRLGGEFLDDLDRLLRAWSPGHAGNPQLRTTLDYFVYMVNNSHKLEQRFGPAFGEYQPLLTTIRDFVLDRTWAGTESNRIQRRLVLELARYTKYKSTTNYERVPPAIKAVLAEYAGDGPNDKAIRLRLIGEIDYNDRAGCHRYGLCAWQEGGFRRNFRDAVFDRVKECPALQYCRQESVTLHAQGLTDDQLALGCARLTHHGGAFQAMFGTDCKPIDGDTNTHLEAFIWEDGDSCDAMEWYAFGVGADTCSGIFWEDSGVPRTARFVTVEGRQGGVTDPELRILNFEHEYAHYLDGRYNRHGGYSGANERAGWIEGFADYFKYEVSPYFQPLDHRSRYSLEDVMLRSGSLRTYYRERHLAVRYLIWNEPEFVAEMLRHMRAGRWSAFGDALKRDVPRFAADWERWLAVGGGGSRVASVTVGSRPGAGRDFYQYGETVDLTVRFTRVVEVSGTPVLAVELDSGRVDASYVGGSGTRQLAFRHVVAAADADADGFRVAMHGLRAGDGAIRDATTGFAAELSLLGRFTDGPVVGDAVNGSVVAIPVPAIAAGGSVEVDVSHVLGDGDDALRGFAVQSADPSVATAEIDAGEGTLIVRGRRRGRTTVTVVGETGASLTAEVAVLGPALLPWVPAASVPGVTGFLRIVNHNDADAEIVIEATDDAGGTGEPVTLSVGANETVHLNSADLEDGNAAKGLPKGVGRGEGDWYVVLHSTSDFDVFAYVRTGDGLLTAMHDRAPVRDGVHRVAMLNPGSDLDTVGWLRLVNPGTDDAAVLIAGVDDAGTSPGSAVTLDVPARRAVALSASDLESGAGVVGALGVGVGKWRLSVVADRPLAVMSLMSSPAGHVTNVSTVPGPPGADGVHVVPLFPSASVPLGRQGLLRVVNRRAEAAAVTIAAFDDGGKEYESLGLRLKAGETVHVNSNDLELGNTAKGLTGSTGAGNGDWRLELSSESAVDVLAYIRTSDGFLTSMHDVVRATGDGHAVVIFNPGGNANQLSALRLVNAGEEDAGVTISGTDDSGRTGGPVTLTVPAGRSRTVTSVDLEGGGDGRAGSLGDGQGKWRLTVESDRPVHVMNLLSSPTGHLTNLSTSPGSDAPVAVEYGRPPR